MGITMRLELVLYEKKDECKTILPNLQATIMEAALHQMKFSNYLTVAKKIGFEVEKKIVTNNRILTAFDEYQHNMLIKMTQLVKYQPKNQSV